VRIVTEIRIEGKRRRRRPKKRWIYGIQIDTETTGGNERMKDFI